MNGHINREHAKLGLWKNKRNASARKIKFLDLFIKHKIITQKKV
jgi:hypothetical protein